MVKHVESPVLVIGLGRFGSALAGELMEAGQEVMAVELDYSIVQHYADAFTTVVHADAADRSALEQLGVEQFDTAVVGIGTSLENSVLTVSNLVELGVKHIWAKANTRSHGEILRRIGAHQVIFPEQEAGERTAHLLSGRLRNFTEFSADYALANIAIPPAFSGRLAQDLNVFTKHGVVLIAVEDATGLHTVQDQTVLPIGGNMLVAGPTDNIDEFAQRL